MIFRDLLRDTLRTLSAHKLRTALTMFGIAWGIVSITLMVAAGEGLRVGQAKVAEQFGKDIMIVFAGRTSLQAGGARAGRRLQWEADDPALVQEQSPACRYVMPELGQGTSRCAARTTAAPCSSPAPCRPFAGDPQHPRRRGPLPQLGGRGAGAPRGLPRQRRQEAALRQPAGAWARRSAVGDFPYTVIGVMQHKEQDSSYDGQDISKVFVPFGAVLRDFPNQPPATAALGRPPARRSRARSSSTTPASGRCAQALGRLHGFDPRDEEAAGIWDTVEEAKAFRKMTDGMKYFLGAVGLATLFIGGIGVMNVMLVAVRERTREIGVRKAVGATRRSIVRQFFLETMIVVFLSGGLGLGVAYGICALVNLLPMPPFFAGLLPTWQSGAAGLRCCSARSRSAPRSTRRAARPPSIPIEALRSEAGG